ncbi:LysR family transcriptional regulator [Variovorax sp. GB1P17]|uniref:LysR family transcriptional regulator n=1 Tax=Variovorax sp. GB1P17 TaxID=3443740 RepID=UPI003F47F3BE
MSHLLYLRTFLSVYRHSSISRAAEKLHLTQPAVSRHIKVLEGRLGYRLFERLPRGLLSTPAGNELERRIASHLDALEQIVGLSEGKGEALAGVVRAGTSSGFSRLVLSALSSLPNYGVRLDLRTAPPPTLLAALVDNDIDLAVTLARIPHRAIEYDLLHESPLLLVCAPRWRDRLTKTAAPRGIPLIDLQGPAPALAGYWRAAFGEAPAAPSAIVPDYQAALDATVEGVGISVIPECLCFDHLQTGRVISQPTRARIPVPLYAAYSKATRENARLRTCHSLLTEAAGGWLTRSAR